MAQIILDSDELREIGIITKTVSPNGQVSIGKEHAGKRITMYCVPAEK